MNTEQINQMKEIVTGLLAFAQSEHPPTQRIKIRDCKCLQLGPDLFMKIKYCNDAMAKGIKFETYSTRVELPGDGFYGSNRHKCTMHLDKQRYMGLVLRTHMAAEGDNLWMTLECREYILFILQSFCPAYADGPYRRSAERVQVQNLVNSE